MRHKGQFVTKRVGKQLAQIKTLCNKRAATKTDREADTPTSSFTFEGRRIVDLGYLAEQLSRGCCVCDTSLQLIDTVSEKRYGLSADLTVACRTCNATTTVRTGKRHHDARKRKTMPVFDVNTKAAAGKFQLQLLWFVALSLHDSKCCDTQK